MSALPAEEAQEWLLEWLTAWNAHALDALTELVTDDIVWSDPAMFGDTVHGHADFRAFTETFFRAFPDVHIDAVGDPYMATRGGGLALRSRMAGTFTGELEVWGRQYGAKPPAFAPTGRRFEIEAVDLYEFSDGRLAGWNLVYDLLDFSRQLGLPLAAH